MPLAEAAQNLLRIDYRKDGLRVFLIFLIFLSCLIPRGIRSIVYRSCHIGGTKNFFTEEKFED